MGQEYYAFTIVGQRVKGEKLFTKETDEVFKDNKNCPEHPAEAMVAGNDMEYCPKCGKHLFAEEVSMKNHFPELVGDRILRSFTDSFGPYKIVASTNGNHYYIGFVPDTRASCPQCGGGDAMTNISFVPEEGELAALMDFLKTHGLLKHEEFGMWTVITCSY